MTVAELQDDDRAAGKSAKRSGKKAEPAVNRLGVILSDLTAEQKKQLGSNGLLVEDVRNSRADLRPGDVILALIDRGVQTEAKSVEQFNALLAKLDKSASVTLLVRRGDSQTFITIKGLGDSK